MKLCFSFTRTRGIEKPHRFAVGQIWVVASDNLFGLGMAWGETKNSVLCVNWSIPKPSLGLNYKDVWRSKFQAKYFLKM